MFLRSLSKYLMLIPVGMLTYDLVYEWFVKARVKIGTFKEWYSDVLGPDGFTQFRNFFTGFCPTQLVDKVMAWPGPLVMAIPPVILYIIYRIIFAIRGGKTGGGGGFVYKSHD